MQTQGVAATSQSYIHIVYNREIQSWLTGSFWDFHQVSRYVSYRDSSIAIRIVSWGYRIVTPLWESRALSVSALRSFRHQSVRSFATKLLNFASFSHSLRNIQSIYSQNIMYIQSRTIRAKMPDESTRERRVLRFRRPTRPKENICRTQPLAVWASAREVSVTGGRLLPSIRSGRVFLNGLHKLLETTGCECVRLPDVVGRSKNE